MSDNADIAEKPESDEPLDEEESPAVAADAADLEAPEADRYEQQLTVDGSTPPAARGRQVDRRDHEVPEADAAEQAQPVNRDGDEWDR